jgi:hypothetical protein
MVCKLEPGFTPGHLMLTPISVSQFEYGMRSQKVAEHNCLAGRPPYQGLAGQRHNGPGARL